MKKLWFILFLLLSLILWGCKSFDEEEGSSPGDNEDGEFVQVDETVPTRKIIYTVYTSIKTDNLEDTINAVRNSLAEDEWFDEEEISTASAYFVIRVKSTRLDAFVNSLKTHGTMSNYKKQATDISIKYQDNKYAIAALEAEIDRLNDLYENASMSDMIEINRRISEATKELNELNGVLREYDSLIDYSVVYLSINGPKAKDNTTLGAKIGNAFIGGWNAVLAVLQGIIIVISAILPFSIIIVPVGVLIFVIYKIREKRKSKHQE